MQFSVSVLVGLLIGGVLAFVARGSDGPDGTRAAWPGWVTLALGVVGAAVLGAALTPLANLRGLITVSIAVPVATVVLGVARLVRRDRAWPVWVGTVLGAAPALFWVWFVLAEIFGPAH